MREVFRVRKLLSAPILGHQKTVGFTEHNLTFHTDRIIITVRVKITVMKVAFRFEVRMRYFGTTTW